MPSLGSEGNAKLQECSTLPSIEISICSRYLENSTVIAQLVGVRHEGRVHGHFPDSRQFSPCRLAVVFGGSGKRRHRNRVDPHRRAVPVGAAPVELPARRLEALLLRGLGVKFLEGFEDLEIRRNG